MILTGQLNIQFQSSAEQWKLKLKTWMLVVYAWKLKHEINKRMSLDRGNKFQDLAVMLEFRNWEDGEISKGT